MARAHQPAKQVQGGLPTAAPELGVCPTVIAGNGTGGGKSLCCVRNADQRRRSSERIFSLENTASGRTKCGGALLSATGLPALLLSATGLPTPLPCASPATAACVAHAHSPLCGACSMVLRQAAPCAGRQARQCTTRGVAAAPWGQSLLDQQRGVQVCRMLATPDLCSQANYCLSACLKHDS